MEKRRGRKEIEVTKRRRWGIKRGVTNLASNQCPKCSSQPGTSREIHRLNREEKGEGGDRGDVGEKGESQKGRKQSNL